MKTLKSQPQLTLIMKHLSPDEQKIARMALASPCRILAPHEARARHCRGREAYAAHRRVRRRFPRRHGAARKPLTPSAVSAPALFNEANAEQRAGDLGAAILGYERAQSPAPARRRHRAEPSRRAREGRCFRARRPSLAASRASWLSFDSLATLASISLLLFSLLVFGTRLHSRDPARLCPWRAHRRSA